LGRFNGFWLAILECPSDEIGWNFYIILLSKSDKFWEESSTITLSSLPKKIIPMDSIFTYYRSILERFS
jgi:hypothetical protein